MRLMHVSMTGADDGTDPKELRALAREFLDVGVEWAVLSSAARAGTPRYPTDEWVHRFVAACPDVKKAIHLCGRDVDAFILGDARILKKLEGFDRVQLNFNQTRSPKDLDSLAAVANRLPHTFIIQHNQANSDACATLAPIVHRMTVLFDASGGRGASPEVWPEALPHVTCGYAGGLGLENITGELFRIHRAAGTRPFWVDMEGKLRGADDRFDLDTCGRILLRVRDALGAVTEWCSPLGDDARALKTDSLAPAGTSQAAHWSGESADGAKLNLSLSRALARYRARV
ncbi:hypothetical protein F6X40_11460 [Paraburkholderia sp. UCT31]|uniref:hypothetical protein n=1 Tax=Paraburkholderia sp. UCT31 TaxID=2615209 RepID=UPI001655AA19|nr:hypothetical protein [Paraburkholderia sp. UCT31]MBC8737422.1 hypothetical protein [Paraburkholderia sp. UCT31]